MRVQCQSKFPRPSGGTRAGRHASATSPFSQSSFGLGLRWSSADLQTATTVRAFDERPGSSGPPLGRIPVDQGKPRGHDFSEVRPLQDGATGGSDRASAPASPSDPGSNSLAQTLGTRPRIEGRCNTFTGLDTGLILASLGTGDPLSIPIRREMDATFQANFENVRVHADPVAARINNRLSTAAFTIGQHIAFSRNSYQPFSNAGRELLGHELAHTRKPNNYPASVFAWQTRAARVPVEGRTYSLRGQTQIIPSSGTRHEDLTEAVIEAVNSHGTVFGERARNILVYWVGQVDLMKTRPEELRLLRNFPEIARFYSQLPESRRGSSVVPLLHSYGGVRSEDIGIQLPVQADERHPGTLTGSGILGTLLHDAVRNFNDGHYAHALRMIGISLHTIQDFYSHHTPLQERDEAVGDHSVLEDDPRLGPWRWEAARQLTRQMLDLFSQQITAEGREVLASTSLSRMPIRDAGAFGVHGVPTR